MWHNDINLTTCVPALQLLSKLTALKTSPWKPAFPSPCCWLGKNLKPAPSASADLKESKSLLIAPRLGPSEPICYIYQAVQNRDKCRANADKCLIHKKSPLHWNWFFGTRLKVVLSYNYLPHSLTGGTSLIEYKIINNVSIFFVFVFPKSSIVSSIFPFFHVGGS